MKRIISYLIICLGISFSAGVLASDIFCVKNAHYGGDSIWFTAYGPDGEYRACQDIVGPGDKKCYSQSHCQEAASVSVWGHESRRSDFYCSKNLPKNSDGFVRPGTITVYEHKRCEWTPGT